MIPIKLFDHGKMRT